MIAALIVLGLLFMGLERLRPDQPLTRRRLWWPRAILLNCSQVGAVVLAGYTLDVWVGRVSLLSLAEDLPTLPAAGIGYLVSTFVYYWWHRLRHRSDLLWRVFHQLHHSPSRLETITAFYKHPAEQAANTLVSALVSYTLLGLSIEAAAWVTAFSALGEFIYHVNTRTPRWLGYLVQRPEMHRVHHARGRHHHNYGDLPLWDMLFGTFSNPARADGPCGFDAELELELGEMLCGRDLHAGRDGGGSHALA